MKPSPPGWPRLSSAVFYSDPFRAIDWLCEAFGFEVRIKVEGKPGVLEHSELTYGEAVVMVSGDGAHRADRKGERHASSPRSLHGANTQSLMLYVDDVEAHCERARKAGAKVLSELKVNDYGEDYWSDRSYEVEDLEGHRWWFCQRLRSPVLR